MPGTKVGGLKAAQKNKERYGKDYYVKIGAKGGKYGMNEGVIKGFARHPEKAREAGRKGGLVSRRTGIKNGRGTTPPRRSEDFIGYKELDEDMFDFNRPNDLHLPKFLTRLFRRNNG